MLASWWNDLHGRLWRIMDRPDRLAVQRAARQVAQVVAAPMPKKHTARGWSVEQARLLTALDENGLTRILSSDPRDSAMLLALSLWELASVDGGAATLSMSGFLAQMPIHDFGTAEQKDRYLGRDGFRHGALCLTEPIPGAGADAIFLSGFVRVAGLGTSGEPMLEVQKRGRFTSHMDFADFVVAAVSGDGASLRGSCLMILEPGDEGLFESGPQVRKLGHRLASTTNPAFDLRVPASRIIGGYTVENGTLIPGFDHRQLIEPALRRTRALLSLMTASKALSTVAAFLTAPKHKCADLQFQLRLAELWAAGEAATSLGFSAVRSCDEFDCTRERAAVAGLLPAAAKLFSSSRLPALLRQVAACEEYASPVGSSLCEKIIDAQIESMYMGPEASQRRQLSAAMVHPGFLRELHDGIAELEALEQASEQKSIGSFAAGARLWLWTLDQLRHQTCAHGLRLYSDARQGVSFAMADALCELLAARALMMDVLALKDQGVSAAADALILADLCTLAAGRAAGRVAQNCAGVLHGYAERFPVTAEAGKAFDDLQSRLFISLRGTEDAQLRLAFFLLAANHPKPA
ncbi:MAG: acyl-CoA dehydrogenase family protein [Terracidiphilus sp.]